MIDNNPNPKPNEIGQIIQTTIEKGFPAKPMRRLYNKDILEKIYFNMFGEDKIIEYGKEVNEINISGQNDEHKMKWRMITTNLHILQSILEYTFDKRYKKKHFQKMNIIRLAKKYCYNFETAFWIQYFLENDSRNCHKILKCVKVILFEKLEF